MFTRKKARNAEKSQAAMPLSKRDPPERAILPPADRLAFLGKEPAGFAGGC